MIKLGFLNTFYLYRKMPFSPFIILSRICRPISIRLDTFKKNHLCIKGIQFFTNKGSGPLQRGDYCKNKVRVI
jgi:hypothetical protein